MGYAHDMAGIRAKVTPQEQLDTLLAELKSLIETAEAEGRDLTDEEAAEADAKSAAIEQLKAKVERSKKAAALLASIGGSVDEEPVDGTKSGHLLLTGKAGRTAAKGIAAAMTRGFGQKAILTPGSVVTPVPVTRDVAAIGQVATSILDLLPTVAHDTPTWTYPRQVVRTNNAAPVAPGSEKPTSIVTTESVGGRLKVVAHVSEPVDKFLLKDVANLERFIASEMLYMLREAVEEQVLTGDGTGENLLGLLNVEGIQSQAFAVDRLTTLRLAALKLESAGRTADAFVVNANDWAAIETARTTTGAFDLGTPVERAAQKVWGTTVVTSTRLAEGTALAVDLSTVALDYGAEGIATEWDRSVGFTKNQVIARVEGRFDVSVFQPDGIVEVDLTEAA